jgi:uncharacterized protein
VPAAPGRIQQAGPARAAAAAPLPAVVVLLGAANLLNNQLAPQAYVATCGATAGAALLLARLDGCSWSELGFGSARPGLRWGLAAAAVALPCYAVAAALPTTRPAFLDSRAAGLSGAEVLVRSLVRIPLGTALLEEVGFRGVLYAMLARRRGVRAGVLASSLAFGLWHVLPSMGLYRDNAAVHDLAGSGRFGGAAAVAGAVAVTTLAGVAFCELRRRSGSLLAPFLLHWALNAGGLVLAWNLTAAR